MDFFTNTDTSQNRVTCPTPITCPTPVTCPICPRFSKCVCNKKNYNNECNNSNPLKTIYTIFHSIITLFAIYLSFKCNNGFSFGGFFMAIFFPHIYIIYKYATSETFCGIKKSVI